MWFKNLTIFRIESSIGYDPDVIGAQMRERLLRECGALDVSTRGWKSPYGDDIKPMVAAVNGCMLVAAAVQEKVIPAAAVREEVGKRRVAKEKDLVRKLTRAEVAELRDNVMTEFLPKAMVQTKVVNAYIDTINQLLVIDTSSPKQAEMVMGLLRETLGSLALSPIRGAKHPRDVLTLWFQQQEATLPDFEVGADCTLIDPMQEKASIDVKTAELTSDEIKAILEAGRLVSKLAMEWNKRVGFTLDDDLVVRGVKFLDLVQEAREEIETDCHAAVVDADFAILSQEVRSLVPRIVAAMSLD